ncbi:MAG: YIP1 family protein [Parachlamydiales bacterium]|nr:YIP1 family protein [Parachlamydiales bacterium]
MIAGLNPWITMWNQPRSTIRAIAFNRPTFGIYYLAIIYALQGFFFYANWWSLGVRTNYPFYLTLGIIVSPLIGILWLYLMGEFFYLSGRLLKGTATRRQLRAAVAWSALPFTITLAMWVMLLFWSPEYVFIQDSGPHSSIFINFITLIAKIWSFILLIQSLRELQHFSTGKAILNVVGIWILSSVLFFVVFSVLRQFVI